MRRTGARRLAPILLVLLAGAGLLGAGRDGDRAAVVAPSRTTAAWASPAGIEAVLPAKLETAFERSGLANGSKQRSALAGLVLPVLLASAAARRAMLPLAVPAPARLCSRALPERGPPLRRFA